MSTDNNRLEVIQIEVGSSRQYHIVSQNTESTVVAEFVPEAHRQAEYQSEADLELQFINTLKSQAYEYLPITSEDELIANLKAQLEKLNGITFSEREWQRFFTECIANERDSIDDKAERIQRDFVQLLKRDDSTTKNIYLLDKDNIHNNQLQVINQYEAEGIRANRYDVTVLVNGLPLVHIELKRRGVALKEAFNQINRYQRESFWAGSGLFEYVQVFVISNGTFTKYYSNTTRAQHIKEQADGARKTKKTSNSFEFTSWWADANNKPITDLDGFAKTFFAKHSLLSILTRYCVFTSDRMLLVMRPYQIVATERILNRILIAENNKRRLGTIDAGGYIWHTTGSGKTLTSFKAAQLACGIEGIEKVLFVVDRKDLDYQTMKEYDKFEKGAADSNTSTAILKKQLEDPSARIIITTIQKLDRFIRTNTGHTIFDGHIVIIFDECHRSQFGGMHAAITNAFKNYHLFGFTGTPIFAANARTGGNQSLKTTEQAFGDKLHTYTIVDAISDKNVLPFRIDYLNTVKPKEGIQDKLVKAIDTEEALLDARRITENTRYILEHFDQKTYRDQSQSFYQYRQVANINELIASKHEAEEVKISTRVNGFNSLFATASIEAAKRYYAEFQRQQAAASNLPLKIALIYSFAANEDEPDGFLAEEGFETDGLDRSSRDFLDSAIADYNRMFGTSYDTSADKFQNYYKDLSLRIKNREVDLCIVVNMFLTGFDATTLNTLWVDKNLRQHGLIQAFSRTNRILNSVKSFGNIVCFRDLEQETNNAVALFGDKDAHGIVLLKPYADYYCEYERCVAELLLHFPPGELVVGENNEKEFAKLYGSILRLLNILQSFDDFDGNELLSVYELQNYQSVYVQLIEKIRINPQLEKESILDDIVFEIELVKQVDIDIDYILMLVRHYHASNCEDKEIVASINRTVLSSLSLCNKKDLINQFVASLTVNSDVDIDWKRFMQNKKREELDQIIAEENLNAAETYRFVENAFRDGVIQESGTEIITILPPVTRFSADGGHAAKKQNVLEKLNAFFNRFFGIG